MQKKAKLVAWTVTFNNVAEARRKYEKEFNEEAPSPPTVHRWIKKFLTYGDINKREEGSGRPVTCTGYVQ